MNNKFFGLMDLIGRCIANIFEARKKQQTDFKEIGQLRYRLAMLQANNVERLNVAKAVVPVGGLGINFRSMSSKEQDIKGRDRWFRDGAGKLVDENSLADLLAESQRSHRERQESGQYPVLRREDLAGIKQEAMDMEAAAAAKLEGFLSGKSDDISGLLWGNSVANMQSDYLMLEDNLSPAQADSSQQSCEQPEVIETTPTSSMDAVAMLEDAIKLDALDFDNLAPAATHAPEKAEQHSRRSRRRRSARKCSAGSEEPVGSTLAVLMEMPEPQQHLVRAAEQESKALDCVKESESLACTPHQSIASSANTSTLDLNKSKKVTPIRSRSGKKRRKDS